MKKITPGTVEKSKSSKFTKSNYRRVTDDVEVRRVTFDLPEELLHRWTVRAAHLRTTKVAMLREILEKEIPKL